MKTIFCCPFYSHCIHIPRYFQRVAKVILKYGGDIVKFAGDAMVVTWIVEDGSELTNAARKFMQCAFSIQEELDAAEVAPGVKFSIKLGGGCGKSTLLFVGGKFGRLEYLMVRGHTVVIMPALFFPLSY